MITREQVQAKRERMRQEMEQKRKFSLHDTVTASSPIPTKIFNFSIPFGTRGRVVYVGKWIECFDVEFSLHECAVVVQCLADQLKFFTGK